MSRHLLSRPVAALFFFAILLVASSELFSQEIKVSAAMEPKQPVFGERILYGLVVTAESQSASERTAPEAPTLPAGEGYKIRYLETRSGGTRSETTIVNGRRSSRYQQSWTIVYEVIPEAPGVIQMPAFEVEIFGAKQRFGAHTFEVAKEAPGNRFCRLSVEVSDKTPYVNQPVKLRLVIECEKPTTNVELKVPWASTPNGFGGEPTPFGWTNGRGVAVALNGDRFDVRREVHPTEKNGERLIYERTLYPIAAGRAEVDGSSLRLDAVTRFRRVFGGRRPTDSVKVVLSTDPIVFEVRGAPVTGRPASFAGIIGNFSGSLELGNTKIKAGDGVTLTLRLEGAGELAALTPPDIASAPGFENFDVYTPDKTIEKGDREGHSRLTMSWLIVPKAGAGVKEFPRWEFSWFVPKREEFETLEVGPTPLEITGTIEDSEIFGSTTGAREAREIRALGEGLRPIKERPGSFRGAVPKVPWALFLTIFFLPIVVLSATAFFLRRRESLAEDGSRLRRRRASKEAAARLQEAESHIQSERGFHGKLARSLVGFVADKLDLPPGRIVASTAADLLQQASVSGELSTEFATFLEALEAKEFGAAAADATERRADFERGESLIRRLDREIKS